MTLTEFLNKYPELENVNVAELFQFDKTIINGKLIVKRNPKATLSDELKKDLIKTFGLF